MTLADELVAGLDGAEVVESFGRRGVTVAHAEWRTAAQSARELGAELFDWLGVADAGRPGAAGAELELTLHVVHLGRREGLLIRTVLPAGVPIPSIADVWTGAAWHEREAAEMFGCELEAHPDPGRLLLAPSLQAHPLRKDFVLVSRAVVPWPGRLEPGESADATGRRSRRRQTPPGVPDEGWLQ